MLHRLHSVWLCVWIFLCAPRVMAQGEANNWFFGHCQALNFSSGVPEVMYDSTMFLCYEGTSSISTPDGKLLLYSDGCVAFNRYRERIENAEDLIASYTSTNAVLCVARPGSNYQIYLFTIHFVPFDLYFTIIDMRDVIDKGKVVQKNVRLLPGNKATEKTTAVHHANGRDIWIITPEYGGNKKHAFLLTDTGLVRSPVTSQIGPPILGEDFLGDMKISFDGRMLAIVKRKSSAVDLYDFNTTTGKISNPRTINTPPIPRTDARGDPPNWMDDYCPYGIEFSLDGKKLYVSEAMSRVNRYLLQYDLTSLQPSDSTAQYYIVDSIPPTLLSMGYGLLQMAPDGKIYQALSWMGKQMGVINNPNGEGAACHYERVSFDFPDSPHRYPLFGTLGLPGFVQSYFNPLRFTQQYSCFNSDAVFRISTMRQNDSVRWDFDDILSREENTTVGDIVTHRFSAPGDYRVTACLHNEGTVDTVRQLVRIYPLPVVATSADTAVCRASTVQLRAESIEGRPPFLYRWEPEEGLDDATSPTPRATVQNSTVYRVTVYDDNNCTAQDSVIITVRDEPSVNFARNMSLCRGDSITIGGLATGGTPPYTYVWSASQDIPDPSLPLQRVAPRVTTNYHVRITDAYGCMTEDSVQMVVQEKPVLLAPARYLVCKGDSTTLNIQLETEIPLSKISWSPAAGLNDTSSLTVTTAPEVTTLYTCTVVSENGCTANIDMLVEVREAATPVCTGDTLLCEGESGSLHVTGDYAEYLWSNGVREKSIKIDTPGTYTVSVRDAFGCTADASVIVRLLPRPQVAITGPTVLYQGDTLLLDAGAGHASYLWSDGSDSRYLSITRASTYRVTVSSENGCTNTAVHEVHVKPRPFVSLALPYIEAVVGDTICITIQIDGYGNIEDFDSVSFSAGLRFDRSMFFPLDIGFIDAGNERNIPLHVLHALGSDTIVWRVCGVVTLGIAEETPLTLDLNNFDPGVFSRSVRTGSLRVAVCREGGARLFDGSVRLRLYQNRPNPFNAATVIRFDIIEQGATRLEVLDLYGRHIATIQDAVLSPGSYTETFDASQLASGQYFYVLRTPNAVVSKIMTVVK